MNLGVKVTFAKAVGLANQRGIKREYLRDGTDVVLSLKDGSRLVFMSNYYNNHSEYTPEDGTEPPECYFMEAGK